MLSITFYRVLAVVMWPFLQWALAMLTWKWHGPGPPDNLTDQETA